MDVLISEVKILDPQSPHHNKKLNIHIKNGLIESIGKESFKASKTIDGKGCLLSPGWFDMNAQFHDPGHEHKEDISSGCSAAAHGGFTGVAVLPNTNPVVQTKGQIEYVKSKSENLITDLHPISALTLETKGEDLTEMIDLHEAGAVAFSDGDQPIWHTDILLKSLIYLQKFDGLLINKPEDKLLTRFGHMNEGVQSTIMGMRGMPALSEYLMISRDLDILEYTGGKIHLSNISSAESVDLIKKAKKKGLNVSCDVSVHHLKYNESHLENYDTNFKSNPPFRTEKDRKALVKGIIDGTLDAIVTTHNPQDEECKKLEFDKADFGLTGLQTALPILLSLGDELPAENWVTKLTSGPRSILGISETKIEQGARANLTLIDPKENWIFDDQSNKSKSRNSPLFGSELTGKVKAIFNGKKSEIFS